MGMYDEADADYRGVTDLLERPPESINWNLLVSEDADREWRDLDAWVTWLKVTFGLPPSIVPPYWHRHDELVWELSALHLHWLCAYDEEQHGSAPLGWHQDFAEARERLLDELDLEHLRDVADGVDPRVTQLGRRDLADRGVSQAVPPGDQPPASGPRTVQRPR